MISWLWVGMILLSLICGTITGRIDEVSAAVTVGAKEAVILLFGITGMMCLWSGVMELITETGIARCVEKVLAPVLRPLFGKTVARDAKAMQAVGANVTANLLGLSNAATPIGLVAADRIYGLYNRRGSPDAVLMLIVLNATSIQLIPSTIGAVRASYGASAPFDIMPAVWGATAVSVLAALISAKVLRFCFPQIEQ